MSSVKRCLQLPFLLFCLQNIIQLNVCDGDPVNNDDIQFIVIFDLSKLQPGNPVLEKFSLKPKVRAKKLF